MEGATSLNNLAQGEKAHVRCINTTGLLRRRMQDIGIIEGTEVTCLQKSPCGDPVAYLIRGAVIALRKEDSAKILVL